MESGTCKVILLNASNMESYPVYPYAFIQVPAVARRCGVEVICQDLLGIPQAAWGYTIQNLIARHDPVMILITLRNTDSMVAKDYQLESQKRGSREVYFPIERTRELIATIREISGKKIAVGGFAFSLLADDMMGYLQPDFGVFGGPDGFFEYFDAIQIGEYQHVPNLLYFRDGNLVSNQRSFYPPYKGAEYTSSKIMEMMGFYESFPDPGYQGAPVEVMRGCCHRCVFCAEPYVEGRRVRYRDLSAVMADIKILADNGITKLYMISSELNPEGNDFLLKLADHIKAFNFAQPDELKVTWFGANYLLNLTAGEYSRLYESGFTGGWFDVTALDDENARAMHTPYENTLLLGDLRTYIQVQNSRLSAGRNGVDGASSEGDDPSGDQDVSWTMFLSNPATTIATIRNTLKIANQEDFATDFSSCSIIKNIRVFDYERLTDTVMDLVYSVSPTLERVAYDQLLPSFGSPPALVEHFGSENAVLELFEYIAETYLSKKYIGTRDWRGFIHKHTTLPMVTDWLAELTALNGSRSPTLKTALSNKASPTALETFFSENPVNSEDDIAQLNAMHLVEGMLIDCMECFSEVFKSLSLPDTPRMIDRLTAYDMATIVYNRWCELGQLEHEIEAHSQNVQPKIMRKFIHFCILAMLYKFNLKLLPEYRALFTFEDGINHG